MSLQLWSPRFWNDESVRIIYTLGVTKVRKRLLTEDEDEEVGSDMQEMVDSTPVKQYTRQQEGFRGD